MSLREHGSSRLATDHPFSELIHEWWAEGDRLAQPLPSVPGPVRQEGRWERFAALIRPVVTRHRLAVLIAIGLLPLALFLVAERVERPPVVSCASCKAAPP